MLMVALGAWGGDSTETSAGMKAGMIAAGMTLFAAMGLATLHLGRPLRAWRAFLGWRTSWFSREILAFGGYAAGLGALLLMNVGDWWRGLVMATTVAGVAGVGCSVLIYGATRRIYWTTRSTGIRFGAATIALGAVSAAVLGMPAPGGPASHAVVGLVAIACMLAGERRPLEDAAVVEEGELYRTTVLLSGPLAVPSRTRHMLAWFVIALLATTLLRNIPGLFVAAWGCLLLSTCIERRLFFTAVAPDRMPGGVAR
jgi:DMSO reductase anchor subunit